MPHHCRTDCPLGGGVPAADVTLTNHGCGVILRRMETTGFGRIIIV
jgi:hypothetical protein